MAKTVTKEEPGKRKEQLIAINTALKEIDEMMPKVEKALLDFKNPKALGQAQELRTSFYSEDPVQQATHIFANVSRFLVLEPGKVKEGFVAPKSSDDAAKFIAAVEEYVNEQSSKPVLPAGEYDKIATAYNALKAMRKDLEENKNGGKFDDCMEIIDPDAEEAKTYSVAFTGSEYSEMTFAGTQKFVSELGAITEAAMKEQTGVLKGIQYAKGLVEKCQKLEALKGQQVFPEDLLGGITSRHQDLDGRVKMAQKHLDKGQFTEARDALKGRNGDASLASESEKLAEIKGQLEAIDAELKELAEVDKGTAPKPAG